MGKRFALLAFGALVVFWPRPVQAQSACCAYAGANCVECVSGRVCDGTPFDAACQCSQRTYTCIPRGICTHDCRIVDGGLQGCPMTPSHRPRTRTVVASARTLPPAPGRPILPSWR